MVIPVAHSTGFGWDELLVFGTILVAILVYRLVRGPIDAEGDANPEHRETPPGERAP